MKGTSMLQRMRKPWIAAAAAMFLLTAGWLWSSRYGAAAEWGSDVDTTAEKENHSYTNRLIQEKSPYLLQHAHNPVDWYPWGKAAFEKARREQKPIFLSVGYSTCHWCHVMERESFSDPVIAEVMNRHFVSIKVDREERPDVDRLYMTFLQATTGRGGWPMSVFLSPDLKPFYAGTYFPAETFRSLLLGVAEAWEKDREKLLESAGGLTQTLREHVKPKAGDPASLGQSVPERTYGQIKGNYDVAYGGFGEAPKFPRPANFNFLLRYYARTGEKDALEMTLQTLRAMARGGIHDHIGGGFHRYSTDRRWHVPHFEKMLYDQAQLALSYADAYQITHDAFFARMVHDILGYVLRDMRSPEGAYYSAEDADSQFEHGEPEHGEGAFYVWKAQEIEQVLGPKRARIFNYHYGVELSGNVSPKQDVRGELKGGNVLIVRHSFSATAGQFGMSEEKIKALLPKAHEKLFEARSQRPRPPLDDKVLTAWNGLMISAFARAAQVLEEPRYRTAAEAAARFIRDKLSDPQTGELMRRYRDGEAAIEGFLSDYAFLVQGLIDLYETSFDVRWLTWAVQLQEKQDQLFWDRTAGGYFSTTGKDPSILIRMRDDYDGAEPSGNSVAALNLLRLAEISDRNDWREKARRIFTAFAKRLEEFPQGMPQLVAALDFHLSKPKQIIIAGRLERPDTRTLLRLVHERYIPNKILLLADGARGQEQISRWLPFVKFVKQKEGQATAYICENYVCKLPTADPRVVAQLLDGRSPSQKGS